MSADEKAQRSAPPRRVLPEEQTRAEWWADYCRKPDPGRAPRGLRLPPLSERYRDPVPPIERLAGALRRERDDLAERLARLRAGYLAVLVFTASLAARKLTDSELDGLLADEPIPCSLPAAVIEDFAPLLAEARRLVERAALRRAV